MREPVTKDEIFAVANALDAEGVSPTVRAIRKTTGGSDSTVHKWQKEWKRIKGIKPANKAMS